MPQHRLKGFVNEVFWNIDAIREEHERMLGALFQKQREFHPLIDSIAEIVTNRTSPHPRNPFPNSPPAQTCCSSNPRTRTTLNTTHWLARATGRS